MRKIYCDNCNLDCVESYYKIHIANHMLDIRLSNLHLTKGTEGDLCAKCADIIAQKYLNYKESLL